MKNDIRYVTYFRVSTRKQGESGLGLDAQHAYLDHFLSPDQVAAEFTEVQSGKSATDRPELQKALNYCRKHGCGLAVAKLDRLSRNTEDTLRILADLDGHLFSADLPSRPGERADKFTLTLLSAIADRERELISVRTKAAMAAKRDRDGTGWMRSGMTAEHRKLGPKAGRQKARDAYRKVSGYVSLLRNSEGLSLRAIAARLNGEGHRTRQGAEFTAATVQRILDRETATVSA